MRVTLEFFAVLTLLAAGCETSEVTQPVDAKQVAACGEPPGGVIAPDALCVQEVRGRVTSFDGAALPNIPVSVCGLACFATVTDMRGDYTILVNAKLPPEGYAVSAYGRPTFSGIYLRLPTSGAGSLMMPPIALAPLVDEGSYLPDDGTAATTIKAGPLQLQVPEGTVWELDLEDTLAGKEGRRFRYARVASERAPAFAANAKEVFALAPFKAKSDKRVRLVIETQAFAPGTPVAFVAMGDDITSVNNTGGLATTVARGHITEDGKRAEMDDAEGLTTLTWIAVRALP